MITESVISEVINLSVLAATFNIAWKAGILIMLRHQHHFY